MPYLLRFCLIIIAEEEELRKRLFVNRFGANTQPLRSIDEMVDFIKKRFEDGLTFEKLELIIEDKDLLAWRDVLIEHGGKRWETTNVQLWKDNKVWRDIVSVRDLEKENCI